MKNLAEEANCYDLIQNIANFMNNYIHKDDYANSVEQLLRFCKKLSKQSKAHEHLVKANIHEIALTFISKGQHENFHDMNEKVLRQHLITI